MTHFTKRRIDRPVLCAYQSPSLHEFMMYHYRAFGLVLASERPLPSLEGAVVPETAGINVDVTIGWGAVTAGETSRKVGDLHVGLIDNGMTARVDEVGTFMVASSRITIDPEPGATDAEVHIYLLGSIIGSLLYLRDLTPFHCNAVEIAGAAFLFCGPSGAGKSTLAAFFERRGHPLLTDDMCAIGMGRSGPIALPGIPRLKLWDDALAQLRRNVERKSLLPWHSHKWELPIRHFSREELPIGGIYHLKDAPADQAISLTQLSGMPAINRIVANVYRRRIGDLLDRGSVYLKGTVELVGTVPVYDLRRPRSLEMLESTSLDLERLIVGHAHARAQT